MKRFIALLISLAPAICCGAELMSDSVYMVDAISVSTIKQSFNLRQEPLSSTTLGSIATEQAGVKAIKDLRTIAPNFYIPDYGSRITSSIYVRGLGARIDNPVIGLNIDNVPYLNKNAFDTDVMDIVRMEVLRGPQSTLYGRNTMGGVVNIYTLMPMEYQGVRASAEYSTGNTYRVRGALYSRLSDRFAASFGAHLYSTDGLFTNEYNQEMCDTERSLSGEIKLQYHPSHNTHIDNTFTISRVDQGGYAYRWISSDDEDEGDVATEEINYNDPCSYERLLVSNGLSIRHQSESFLLSAITGFQYLDDAMILDNDFTPESIFTLTQATREHSFTEDIVIRSLDSNDKRYSWLFGAFGLYKSQTMDAPVTFKEDGIEQLILSNINGSNTSSKYYIWGEDEFLLNSDFVSRSIAAALYHESTLQYGRWRLRAGIRLDYEHASLDYRYHTATSADFYKDGGYSSSSTIEIEDSDCISQEYFEVLPKLSVQYSIGQARKSSLYASVSKGYKAGGYNTQIFSDILTQELMEYVGYPFTSDYTAEEVISYDPEHSWNYEVGAHLTNQNGTLRSDIALFYIDCLNQQLTVLPEGSTSTGRMMTNAGQSRSYGAEVSLFASISNLRLNGSYGYTNAKFVEYTDGDTDYAGKYVPYAPQHTLFGSASYSIPLNRGEAKSIRIEANCSGVGRIYWNEENSVSQPLYTLIGGSISLEQRRYTISVWGRNITNSEYNTFYFKSLGNEFVQPGRASTYGVSISLNLTKQ